MKDMVACKNCHRIVSADNEKCPYCGGELSKNWKGYMYIVNPEKSEIAKMLEIKDKGEYAIKVR